MIVKQHSLTFFEVGTQCLNRLLFKKTKAKRLILNCIFFTQYLVSSWRFLHNQPAACLSKDNYGWEITLLWWSVFQQTTATTDQKVWWEEMTEKQIMKSTLISRTAIITQYLRLSWCLIANEQFVQAKITTKYVNCIIWKRTYPRTKI